MQIAYRKDPRTSRITVDITDSQRGLHGDPDCPPGSGHRPCRDFTVNPSPATTTWSGRNLTGYYETEEDPGGPAVFFPQTLQINQAGPFVFGFLQITLPVFWGQSPRLAATAFFQGRWQTRGHRIPVTLRLNQPGNRNEPPHPQNTEIPVELYAASDGHLTLHFQVALRPGGSSIGGLIPRIPGRYRFRRVNNETRPAEPILWRTRTSNPLIFQYWGRPLRSGQVAMMRDFIRRRLRQGILAFNTSSASRQNACFENLFDLLNRSLQYMHFSPRRRGNCQCRCHGNSAHERTPGPTGSGIICSCAPHFSRDQKALGRMVFLRLLETENLTMDNGAGETTTRTALAWLYHTVAGHHDANRINDHIRGGPISCPPEDHESGSCFALHYQGFRRFFELMGGFNYLPLVLHLYRYDVTLTWLHDKPRLVLHRNLPVEVIDCEATVETWLWDDVEEDWQRRQVFSMRAYLGDYTPIPLPETDEVYFSIHSWRNWGPAEFAGYFDLFAGSTALPWMSGHRGVSVIFESGNTSSPMIKDAVEHNLIPRSAPPHYRWMPGRLWSRGGGPDPFGTHLGRDDTARSEPDIDVELFFETDQVQPRPGSGAVLGYVIAEYLLLFQSPMSTLSVEGHASSRHYWHYNLLLSIRRAQFVLQEITVLLGSQMTIPFPSLANQAAARDMDTWHVQLHAFGEEDAARRIEGLRRQLAEESPDEEERNELISRIEHLRDADLPEDRRVDVMISGSLALRFPTVPDAGNLADASSNPLLVLREEALLVPTHCKRAEIQSAYHSE